MCDIQIQMYMDRIWTKLIIPDLIKMLVVDWSMTCSYKTHAPGL